jgi:uncharacterized protein (AIM24 family)
MIIDEGMAILNERISADGKARFQGLAWRQLEGSADPRLAETLFYARQTGVTLKTLRISLKDSSVRIEPGSLYFMKGSLEMEASTGGGLLAGLSRKFLTGESFLVSQVVGTGDIYLEPTFGHFILEEMRAADGGRIANKGMFYAGTGGLRISATRAKTLVAAGLGGEGLFETLVDGDGIAAFYSPVPESEIEVVRLRNEKLSVDGNFAVMRAGNLRMHVTKSNRSWIGSSVSGEGFLNTYEGTGTVWLAPTQVPYQKMAQGLGMGSLVQAVGVQGKRTNKAG